MSRWNAKADANTYVIMWAGAILAVLIISTWYFQKIYPMSREVQEVNSELDNLQAIFNKACSSLYLKTDHNPSIERGTIQIKNSNIYLNTSRKSCRIVFENSSINNVCTDMQITSKSRMIFCNTNVDKVFDLSQISFITIEKLEDNSFNIGPR